ncbi:MAG: NAD(P)/FAD-dependent oxidoreductase [Chloroflexi bacterium]|nr:NAD(P)/FAD-dependent oxidoreductase [Chloroflexota bacterium]
MNAGTAIETSVGVLGGGALGLTVGYRLAQRGHRVTVIEKEPEVGGLAAGFPVGPSYLEKFYHHIFRTDRVIEDLIRELGLGSRLHWGRPKTSNLYQGKPRQLDSATSVLRFSPLSIVDRLRLGAGIAYLKVQGNYRVFEGTTAAAWIRQWMGQSAYDIVWHPMLRSKFGDHYQRVAMPWFWSRVHLRTPSLGYLRGGFHHLYLALAERITGLGGSVELGETVTRIAGPTNSPSGLFVPFTPSPTPRERGNAHAAGEGVGLGGIDVTTTGRGTRRFDQVVCTLPTRLFTRLTERLPDDYRARYEWGDFHGAHCVILELDRQLLRDGTYWLSVTDPGYPFLAVVEHTNFLPLEDYGGRRLVYLGNYLPITHRYFSQPDDQTVAEFLPHLRKLAPDFDESWVKGWWVFKAPYAQPIVTVDYPEHLPGHETPIPNLYLANMFMVYPHDRGQNYSIAMGDQVAQLVHERATTRHRGKAVVLRQGG